MKAVPTANMFAPHEHTHRCVHGELHERRAAPVLMTPQAYGDDPWHGRIMQLLPDTLRGGSAAAIEQQYPEYEPPSAVRKPLRIHFDVSRLEDDPGFSCFSWGGEFEDETGKKTQCGWNDVITESKRRLLTETLLPGVGRFFSELLSVRHVHGPLRIRSSTCGFDNGVIVPQWMRDHGVPDTDLVVFLTMRPINSYETVAFAGHCEQDQTGRPTASQFNWAPSQLTETSSPFMIE